MWSPAPLVGAALGDIVRYVAAATVSVVLGLILGFDAGGGVPGILGAIGLVAIFVFGLAWSVDARAAAAVFLSKHLRQPVDAAECARGIRRDRDQPDLARRRASRGLMYGDVVAGEVLLVLAEAAVLTAVFVPLTAHLHCSRS